MLEELDTFKQGLSRKLLGPNHRSLPAKRVVVRKEVRRL